MPDAYAVVPDATSVLQVMPVLRVLRAQGVRVQMHAASAEGMGSMKSQFKKADASGARFALIFGTDELVQGLVSVKPLRGERGAEPMAQTSRSLFDVAAWAGDLRTV